MRQPQTPNMALTRQRLLTLVYGDMETVRMVRPSTRPPQFHLAKISIIGPAAHNIRRMMSSLAPHYALTERIESRNSMPWLEIGSNRLRTPSSVSGYPSTMSISRPP